MNEQFNAPMQQTPAAGGNERIMAIASLVLGVINLCAWFLPICGVPLGIAGVALGYFGMRDQNQKTLAIIGMVLSGIGILLACVNAIAGAFFGPQLNDIFNQINNSLAP